MVFTQPNVRTHMTKSKIQMNHASGFRRSARLGVELALNVLPLDIVLCGSAALTTTVDDRDIRSRAGGASLRALTTRVKITCCERVYVRGASASALVRKQLSLGGSALLFSASGGVKSTLLSGMQKKIMIAAVRH